MKGKKEKHYVLIKNLILSCITILCIVKKILFVAISYKLVFVENKFSSLLNLTKEEILFNCF